MPRRRTNKVNSSSKKPRGINKSDGKIKKWNTVNDIPLTEEDQFHKSRDHILLEDKYQNESGDDDDDEVFALKGLDEDEDDALEDPGIYEDSVEQDENSGFKRPKVKSKKKRKAESSEEEEEEETWGRSKSAYYSSNAAMLESDDEEGNDLEEQEAQRIQQKFREEWVEGDFGLNDVPDIDKKEEIIPVQEPSSAILPALPTDKAALVRHLEKTSPEALALARDWDDTAHNLVKTQAKLEKLQADESGAIFLGMVHIYYQALLSYSVTLAFYLYLRSSSKYAQRPKLLEDHPVLQRLLTLKQSLITLEELEFDASDSDVEASEDEDEDEDEVPYDLDVLQNGEEVISFDEGLEPDELAGLLRDAAKLQEIQLTSPDEKRPRKKRKTSKEDSKSLPVFDLEEPEFVSSNSSSSRPTDHTDVYGESVALQQVDAADKSARKKSLRFHTAKIESASARRKGARNQAIGGDDDLPYRERRKDKEAKVKSVKIQGGEDLDETEPLEHTAGKRMREGSDDDEADISGGYYELVKRKSKEKKEKKKAEYENTSAAIRHDVDESIGGPRSLTRAILANKGLTPHRPKTVRNPRVKKRLRYEKAKRKVSSQKAVYKGGLSNTVGRYEGERSGISKVVKSVRLG